MEQGGAPCSLCISHPHPLLPGCWRCPSFPTSLASLQSRSDSCPGPGLACTFRRLFTDLVGKEQIAHSVVIGVLHDGSDHLQHWGDACKTRPRYTEGAPGTARWAPEQGDTWDPQAWPQPSLLP